MYIPITESEALSACVAIINEFEEESLMTKNRYKFARKMFTLLSPEDAILIRASYPFRDIIGRSEIFY